MGAKYRDLVRKHSEAKGSARSLLNTLADYADDDGLAWPGRSALANDTGMSERNVIRCLQALCDQRRLSIEENAGGGRGRKPIYKIWFPELGEPASTQEIEHTERVSDCHPLGHKNEAKKGDNLSQRVTNEQQKGDMLSLKGDKSAQIPSHAQIEPQEPTTEPMGERTPAQNFHNFFDPRKFVNGKVPAGTGATPAEVFYEVHTLKDDRQVLSSHALVTISERVDDLARWRAVVSEWELCSYKATNVKGQLDWYRDGIPKRNAAATNGVNGTLSEAEKSKFITRARTAQGNIRIAEKTGSGIDPTWTKDIEVAKGYGLI